MKKAILYSFLASLFFLSCHKESKTSAPITPTGKTYKVQFKVDGFKQTTKPFNSGRKLIVNSTDSSSTDSLTILYYLVFTSRGKFIHQITETTDSLSFANINDNLPPGDYQIFFAAGKTGLYTDTTTASLYYTAPGDTLGNWHDTFTHLESLTVTGNSSENVTLERKVGALRININDAIPANAAKIVTSIEDEYAYKGMLSPFDGIYSGPFVKILTTAITPTLIGKTNLQQYTILVNLHGGIKVTITAYDASNNVIGNAVIPGVSILANRESILSGNLFPPAPASSPFNISVNNTWDPSPYRTISF